MLNEALVTAQTGGPGEQGSPGGHSERGCSAAINPKGKDPTEQRHLPAREFVPRVAFETWIEYLQHFGVAVEERGDPGGVFRVSAHSVGQRTYPTQHQPAVEGGWNRAAVLLNPANLTEKIVPVG